jgi:RimJ/RimL family protein N-acetyltransferase
MTPAGERIQRLAACTDRAQAIEWLLEAAACATEAYEGEAIEAWCDTLAGPDLEAALDAQARRTVDLERRDHLEVLLDGLVARRLRHLLSGERCRLRALRVGDAESIAQHANDPLVARNLFDGFPQPYTLEIARAWCTDEHREIGYGHVFAVDVDGEAIGCCGVVPEHGWLRSNAEVGYWIGRAYQRRGIGTEMLRLLARWAWATLPDVERLYAPIFARNDASQAVARAAGFVLEGRMPRNAWKDGVLIERVVYGLYRSGPG